MTPDRWQTIKEIFNAAVMLPPAERAGFLADACGDDEAVRSEVASLLAAHAGDEDFLAVPAFAMGAELLMDLSGGPSAGDQVGPYKILSELGSGGMGDVFLALDTRLGRNVALKLLPVELARDLQRVRRFEQEARTASALNHPNVCVIHEIGKTSDGRQFIAMEYIDGVTLRTRLGQKRMTLTETLDVGAQVAWALEAAHAAGVVHRDIKPENIMLRRDGYVKVLDFGIAKLNENISPPLAINEASTLGKVHTDPGTRMGTVKYMSPEQLRERPVDERTDIWSLGVVLHEMATGATPFAARTTNETIAAILERQPLSFAGNAEQIPAGFRQITKKALSKNRRDRYQKVSSLAADLRQLRRQIDAGSHGELRGPETVTNEEAKVIPIQDHSVAGHAGVRQDKGKTLATRTAESIFSEIKEHKKMAAFATVAAVLAVLLVIPGFPRVVSRLQGLLQRNQQSARPIQTMEINPVTNSGKSVCAAISPDGKTVAHAEEKNGLQELLLTGVWTGSDLVLATAGKFKYRGISFSRDGSYVYYARSVGNESGSLYQVAQPGNTTIKIMDGVDSPITFSPNGHRFAFVREKRSSSKFSLVVAAMDGSGEQTILSRGDGKRLSVSGPAWSPDGKTVVCASGWWDNGYHMNLIEVDAEGLSEKVIGQRHWYSILQVAWLEDQSGLVISAKEEALSPYQLWRVSYPDGGVARITSGTTEYKSVSLTHDGDKIMSVQTHQRGQLWVGSSGDDQPAREVTTTVGRNYGLDWTSKGKIVFSSMDRSNLNISSIDPDSATQTKLTGNEGDNYLPATSPDGRYIVFSSNRSGSFNIWRMNAEDGSEAKQLTFGDGNSYPTCSADSQWVLYDNISSGTTLWKVPIDGGTPVPLTSTYTRMPVVSPNNQSIACRYRLENGREGIAILPYEGGRMPRRLPIPIIEWQRVQWTPDGRALTYIEVSDGVSNIWRYDLDSGSRKQLTDFQTDKIFAYAWTPDHKQFATVRGSEIRYVTIIDNWR